MKQKNFVYAVETASVHVFACRKMLHYSIQNFLNTTLLQSVYCTTFLILMQIESCYVYETFIFTTVDFSVLVNKNKHFDRCKCIRIPLILRSQYNKFYDNLNFEATWKIQRIEMISKTSLYRSNNFFTSPFNIYSDRTFACLSILVRFFSNFHTRLRVNLC